MSILKKLLFTALFVVITLAVPGLILLMTVDASASFGAYVIVYGIIIFAVFGYLIVSIQSLSKEINRVLEEIKMQNAAIAYKLTNTTAATVEEKEEMKDAINDISAKDSSSVNLNPADPLTIDGKVVSSETFGDFE